MSLLTCVCDWKEAKDAMVAEGLVADIAEGVMVLGIEVGACACAVLAAPAPTATGADPRPP